MGASRWKGLELKKLRLDYENHELTLASVAERNRTGLGTLVKLARKHNWATRRLVIRNEKNPDLEDLKRRRTAIGLRMVELIKERDNLDHKIRVLEEHNPDKIRVMSIMKTVTLGDLDTD